MKRSLTITILSLLIVSSCFAETIKLKSGESFDAKIIEETNDYIKIDMGGAAATYFLDAIERVGDEKLSRAPVESLEQESSKEYSVEKIHLDTYYFGPNRKFAFMVPDGFTQAQGRFDGKIVAHIQG